MSRWSSFRRMFGPDPRGDVEDELSFHIAMREQELMAQGETPERARSLALARFGDYETSRSQCVAIDERRGRRLARAEYFDEFRQDVKYALRSLARRPGFTLVAVLTLALGIGANSAIFSVVNAVLLRSLPFREPAALWEVKTVYPDGTGYPLSAPDFMSIADHNRVFDGVAGFGTGVRSLLGRGEPRELNGAIVTKDFFEIMGMAIAHGRAFTDEEHAPGNTGVIILSDGFWQQEFGGSRAALGSDLDISGTRYRVVGVLAPGARIAPETQGYIPVEYGETFSSSTERGRRGEFLTVIGRAKAGVTPEAISADMRRLGRQLQADFPGTNERLTFDTFSFMEEIVGPVRLPLLILLGAVGLVVLIACANVANLLLARASARQGELAVRAALGAGRGRLVRQLVTESLVLAGLGGSAGLAIAYVGTQLLANSPVTDIPRLDEAALDTSVVLFTLGTALLTALLFGLAPALHATSRRMMQTLREGGRGSVGGSGQRLRSSLIVSEMALAVMLLVGAGLLIRSFVEITRVDPGFRTDNGVSFRVVLQGSAYTEPEHNRQFLARLTERLSALPGVSDVAAASVLPLTGLGAILGPFNIENGEPLPDDVNSEIAVASVTPDYFRALGTPVLLGRAFTADDREDRPPIAILNEAAVQRWFKGANPVGKRVILGDEPIEVVGVVRDLLQEDPRSAAAPQLFRPYQQRSTRALRIVLHTSGDPESLAPGVSRAVHEIDPDLPVTEYAALQEVIDTAVAAPRFYTSLLTLFAGIALALAAIGIFGVMSYSVAQRTREISLRMVLGARSDEVMRMIVGRAMSLAALGLVLGFTLALMLGRVLESQLFGVKPADPLTLGGAVLVLAASAGLASYLPARRAARLEPGLALRESA